MPLSNGNVNVNTILSSAIATGAGGAVTGVGFAKTYHASGTTTAGAGAATIQVQGSMNGSSWDTIGTVSLTLGTTATSDGFASTDRYAQVRGNVTAISGTGAAVSLTMGF